MATSEENQLQVCDSIMAKMRDVEGWLFDLKEEYRKEKAKLQEICNHSFFKEDDGDYHRPGHYFICSKCQFVTRVNQKIVQRPVFG